MSQIHNASDGITLLAASSKFVKSARLWYKAQKGSMVSTWVGLRQELLKIFQRKASLCRTLQKLETEKWNASKKTFDQYASAKIALMNKLDLSDSEVINMLIGGVSHALIKAEALSLTGNSVEDFLDKMRPITKGCRSESSVDGEC